MYDNLDKYIAKKKIKAKDGQKENKLKAFKEKKNVTLEELVEIVKEMIAQGKVI